MPELPDILAYIVALETRVVGKRLDRIRLASPFLLRTFDPPIREVEGARVTGLRRLGKRIALQLDNNIYIVVHLMISGRLHWRGAGVKLAGKRNLAAFDFENGSLLLTEASSKKRASLHLVRGEAGLAEFDRGGLEVGEADLAAFQRALTRENHTVKRALTDPRLFSGIGNAYSDEILHAARLSPAKWTSRLTEEEIEKLFRSTRETLEKWSRRFVADAAKAFPERVTAFREGMAVHGRYGKPCPDCGSPVQRIVYAENESNYCATCQTGGKLLADRALSQLLRGDWPKTLDELEERKGTARAGPREGAPLTLPSPPVRGRRGDGLAPRDEQPSRPPLPAGEGRGEGRPARVLLARKLRKRTTDAETILWRSLRSRRFGRFKFRRQHPLGNYVLDFYCDEAKLAIELDGGQHARKDQSVPDKARTAELEKRGIRVLRFWNNEVSQNFEGVLIRIAEALASSGSDR